MQKNYVQTTQAAKIAAREERRLKYFLELSGRIYREEQEVDKAEGYIKEENKRKAVREFEFKQFTPKEHPDYDNLKKHFEDANLGSDKTIENLNKEKEGYQKQIAQLKEDQDKVASGKTKFDYDKILERARELIATAIEKGFLSGEYDKEEVK